MRHAACRKAIVNDYVTERVEQHIGSCDACAQFARRVRGVVSAAPSLALRAAPHGLAERVISSVRQADGKPAGPGIVPLRARRGPSRPVLLVAASVAAAAALVAGVLATKGPREPARDFLLAAAEATEDVRTARLRFEASASSKVRIPVPSLPELSAVPFPSTPTLPEPSGMPPELRKQMEQQQEEMRRKLEEQRKAFEAERAAALERAKRSIPAEMSLGATVEGTGEIALPDRLHVRGTMRPQTGGPVHLAGGDFESIVVGDRTFVRARDAGWYELPPKMLGPYGPLVLDPDAMGTLLRSGTGAEDLGVETLDGVRVRHFRFRTKTGALSSGSEAWIGVDDNIVRKMTMSAEGAMGAPIHSEWRSTTTITLFDFGADVSIEPPKDVRGPAPTPGDGASFLVYPFGYSFSMQTSAGSKT